jgi:predicted Zn-dependent protease
VGAQLRAALAEASSVPGREHAKKEAPMSAQRDTQIPSNACQVLEDTTMRSIFGIPEEALDAVMATAYQLYQAGRYPEVEVLCRGLIAADHKYWWSYSLYAATLRRLGRLRDAVEQLERGLVYEPEEAKLLVMRDELRVAMAREESAAGDAVVAETNNDSHAAA